MRPRPPDVDPSRYPLGVCGGVGDGGAQEGCRPRRVPHRILTKREVNAEQYRIGIGDRHGSRQLVVDQPIEVGLDHDVRDDKGLAPVADHQRPLDQLAEGLEGVGVLPAPPVAGDVETRAMAGQLCGPVGDALEPAHLVARLESGAVGDAGSRRHLSDVGGEHLQPMGREAERGVPAVEELDPSLRQTVVVTGPVDLAEQPVDHVFVAVLELVVPSIRRPPRIAEYLPVAGAEERPLSIAAVPLDDVVVPT